MTYFSPSTRSHISYRPILSIFANPSGSLLLLRHKIDFRPSQVFDNMSDKELSSSASSNHNSSERQVPPSNADKLTATTSKLEEQEEEVEGREGRQLTGTKVRSGLDLAALPYRVTRLILSSGFSLSPAR